MAVLSDRVINSIGAVNFRKKSARHNMTPDLGFGGMVVMEIASPHVGQ